MPPTPSSRLSRAATRRHNPLADDLSHTASLSNKSASSTTGKRKSRSFEESKDGYIDASSSRKILAISRDLAEEDAVDAIQRSTNAPFDAAFNFDSRSVADTPANEEDEFGRYGDADDGDWMQDEDVQEDDIDPSDLAVYNKLLPPSDGVDAFTPSLAALSTGGQVGGQTRQESQEEEKKVEQSINLADLILDRIAEKEALTAAHANLEPDRSKSAPQPFSEIPPKVTEVFTKCGQLLSRYRSGPLPKPFKILPTLPAWPDLLAMTRPDSWTPNAVLAATRIFISAPPDVAQQYLNMVLLDRVKEDIYENKKLNVHLYDGLKKALYKPAAFFKGVLFPLVIEGCTLREANIISSVLVRVSVPVLHSAAALLRLCEIAAEQSTNVSAESAGACNIFIRVLLEKKYALPYKAVDALVFHFLRFRNSKPVDAIDSNTDLPARKDGSRKSTEHSKLPVLWHQSLLVFAQRYKNDITEDQREAFLDLLLVRGHNDIGPEVRRELLAGRVRPAQEPGAGPGSGGLENGRNVGDDGDDTMIDMVT